MFYRIPDEFFFHVVKVDESDFFDGKETKKDQKKDIGENEILKEADEEYLESEIEEKEKSC